MLCCLEKNCPIYVQADAVNQLAKCRTNPAEMPVLNLGVVAVLLCRDPARGSQHGLGGEQGHGIIDAGFPSSCQAMPVTRWQHRRGYLTSPATSTVLCDSDDQAFSPESAIDIKAV